MAYSLKKISKSIVSCAILLSFSALTQVKAQETWSLEKCIEQAQTRNLSLKQAALQVKDNQLLRKQNVMARYPSISANSSYGLNFGRSVNPSTYQFENRSSSFNSWQLRVDVPIYQGGRLTNQIQQSELDVQAAQADAENTANTVALQVAQGYLQILLNEEQLDNTKKRLKQGRDQLERAEKQIRAGSLAPNARFELQAQIARNEQSVVSSQNAVNLAYLNLKQLLLLDPDFQLKIEKPNLNTLPNSNTEGYQLKAIFNQALGRQPIIKAGEYRIRSAEVGVRIAQAALLPSVNVGAGINTNYSSSITNPPAIQFVNITQPVLINNNPSSLTLLNQPTYGGEGTKTPYLDQIQNNFGQGINLSIQIPIFEQGRNRIGVERAKLGVERELVRQETNKQQLKTDIMNAIANARAAQKSYEAAQKTYEAQKAAFEATEKRFSIGNASSFELSQARINLDAAETDVVFSKYDFLFKLKIVDFYEGKPLNMK